MVKQHEKCNIKSTFGIYPEATQKKGSYSAVGCACFGKKQSRKKNKNSMSYGRVEKIVFARLRNVISI